MAFIVKDRIKETTTTTGTGTITLAGASAGFRSFSDIGNGNQTYYAIVGATEWEVGIGTYTSSGTTLSRTTVLSNSLGTTALISFSAGVKDVFCTYPSSAATITVSTTPPSTPVNGTLWWSSDEGKLKIYYVDANSSQWVDALTSSTGSLSANLSSPLPIGDVTPNTGKFTTLETTGNTGIGVTNDGTAVLQIGAGSTTKAPLEIISGTLMTTPDGGSIEYDGNVFYATEESNNRGILAAEHFVVLQSTNTLTSQTAAQPLFDGGGGSANGALNLGTGTYFFECQFNLSSMSTTSGSFGFSFGGTATLTQYWHAFAKKTALATAAAPQYTFNTAANTTLATASTTAVGSAMINGTIDITVAGTIIPQVSLTVAAAAVVGAGSYFKIRKVGSATISTVGNWS